MRNYVYVNLNGQRVEFGSCVAMMDNELREEVHNEISPCSEQEFINVYAEKHFQKYDVNFEI